MIINIDNNNIDNAQGLNPLVALRQVVPGNNQPQPVVEPFATLAVDRDHHLKSLKDKKYLLTEKGSEILEHQGISHQIKKDPYTGHGHANLASIRSYLEIFFLLSIYTRDIVLEIAASARTIGFNLPNWYTTRPDLAPDYAGDRAKYIKNLDRDPSLQCACTGICSHADTYLDKEIHKSFCAHLYSCDVFYYTAGDILYKQLQRPKIKSIHTMHIPKQDTSYSTNFLENEGEFTFTAEEGIDVYEIKGKLIEVKTIGTITMAVRGNDYKTYKNYAYFTKNNPNFSFEVIDKITLERTTYNVGVSTLRLVDTVASYYGNFQFRLGNNQPTQVSKIPVVSSIHRQLPTNVSDFDFNCEPQNLKDGNYSYTNEKNEEKHFIVATGEIIMKKVAISVSVVNQLTKLLVKLFQEKSTLLDDNLLYENSLKTTNLILTHVSNEVKVEVLALCLNYAKTFAKQTQKLFTPIKIQSIRECFTLENTFWSYMVLYYTIFVRLLKKYLIITFILTIASIVLILSFTNVMIFVYTITIDIIYILYYIISAIINIVTFNFTIIPPVGATFNFTTPIELIMGMCSINNNFTLKDYKRYINLHIHPDKSNGKYDFILFRGFYDSLASDGITNLCDIKFEDYIVKPETFDLYFEFEFWDYVNMAPIYFLLWWVYFCKRIFGIDGKTACELLTYIMGFIGYVILFVIIKKILYFIIGILMKLIRYIFLNLIFITKLSIPFVVFYFISLQLESIHVNTQHVFSTNEKLQFFTLTNFIIYQVVMNLLFVCKTALTDKIYLEGKCTTIENFEKLEIEPGVIWNVKQDGKKISFDGENAKCSCIKKKMLVQLADTKYKDPIIYNDCFINILSAIRRLCQKMINPDPEVLIKFKNWFDRIFKDEIEEILNSFDYCPNQWFNGLSKEKQNDVIQYLNNEKGLMLTQHHYSYSMFVKMEKQITDGINSDKTRCIAAPHAYLKYAMGPITSRLETLFKTNFKGYKIGDNWEDWENNYKKYESMGLDKTFQLDGSGFDNTQHQKLKNIVDHKIYNYIRNNIHHISLEEYDKLFFSKRRTINLKQGYGNKSVYLGNLEIEGRTFSGSPDTSLMNTIRMICYNRFVVEEIMNCKEYELMVKGDDTVIFFRPNVNNDFIIKCFDKVFLEKKLNGTVYNHGLGQIAKFYKIGDISDIDFCSTHTVPIKNGYKIVRQFYKMIVNDVWSDSGNSYNSRQLHTLVEDFVVSSKVWTKGSELLERFYQNMLKPWSDYSKEPLSKNKPKSKLKMESKKPDFKYTNQVKWHEQQLEVRKSSSSFELGDYETFITSKYADHPALIPFIYYSIS